MNLQELPDISDILEQLTEQLEEVFFIFDTEANLFQYLNPAFDDIWGFSRSQAMKDPKTLIDPIPEEDREYLYNIWKKDSWRTKQAIEFRISGANNNLKWVSLKLFPLQGDNIRNIMGFAEDITLKKEHQFVLLKYAERKNAILHSISHDLAGPIQTIHSLLSVIEEESKVYDNTRLNKSIICIQKTCQNSINLIKELLNNEFLESSAVELNKWRFDLAFKIEDIVRVYRQSDITTPKNIRFSSSHPQVFITADETKIMQIINNLISNANKFTPSGGTIQITLTDQEDSILLTVADTGIGIPEALQTFLFDKFTKARRPGLLGEEPVGLGMSIIKNIVDLHEGKIWFKSQENKGSIFYVQLPKE